MNYFKGFVFVFLILLFSSLFFFSRPAYVQACNPPDQECGCCGCCAPCKDVFGNIIGWETCNTEYCILKGCGGGGGPVPTNTPTPTPTPVIPNCTNLSCSPNPVVVGQSVTCTADFSSSQGNLSGEINAGQSSVWIWQPGSVAIPGTSGTRSFTWNNPAAGSYDVFGRAWNDGIAECRGNASYVDGPPRYTCAGPNCSLTLPVVTPTPYPTVAISGLLREYNGVSCTNDISSTALSITINPQYPAGVTPVCGITPPSGFTKSSYRCTVVFDNQGANPTPAQNLNLSSSASEYQSAYWTDSNSCVAPPAPVVSIAANVAAPVPTTTYNKDIFFASSGSWIKLKDLSFSGNANINNPIPLAVSAYDSDDNTLRYFITSDASTDAGVASANAINLGTAQVSANNWKIPKLGDPGYTRTVGMSPTTFLDYVKSRKDYTSVDPGSFNLSSVSSRIYYITGTITNLSGNAGADAVIIVQGDVTITGDLNTSFGKALAILATGNITATTSVSNIYAILAAGGSFDTGTGSGLKIKGNLSANTLNNQRTQSNSSQPSLFIMNDAASFIKLLPYLSISKYDQTIQ